MYDCYETIKYDDFVIFIYIFLDLGMIISCQRFGVKTWPNFTIEIKFSFGEHGPT